MLESVKTELIKISPFLVDSLQGPASLESINALGEYVGLDLPEDFISLYSQWNGNDLSVNGNFAYGIQFLPVEICLSHLKRYESASNDFSDTRVLDYADPGIDKSYAYSKSRIPIADDYGSSLICVDLSPAENGTYGQVFLFDYEYSYALKLAASITEYISKFEHDLKNDRYGLNQEALQDGTYWLEPTCEIDVVNWHESSKWSHIPR